MEIESDPKKRGAGKIALVVDDNAAIRKMVAHAFLSDGFKTCGEAANGREAIVLAKQINPDVIVLDLSMPVMNGLSAASELRKIFPSTPIIFIHPVWERSVEDGGFRRGREPGAAKNRAVVRGNREGAPVNGSRPDLSRVIWDEGIRGIYTPRGRYTWRRA